MSSKTEKTKKSKFSRSKQAGLIFPVIKIEKRLKKRFPKKHFKKHVDVRFTATIEYALGQLLEECSKLVINGKYITPDHISKVISDKDGKLYNMFSPNVAGIK